MATTPGGLPYPVGTDKVVDGDDAIKALATTLDDFNTPRSAIGSSGGLSGADTAIATLALPVGKWALLLTVTCDWSVTGAARYLMTIHGTDWATLASTQVYIATTTGTIPAVMQVVRYVVATAGNVTFTAYQQGVTGGQATLVSAILTARRVA